MKSFKPWPYQQKMIEFAVNHPRCGLFVPMGMGKTSASLAIIQIVTDVFDQGPVLVVAPLAVARTTWPAEVRKWEEFKNLRISTIVGTPKQRARAVVTPADIYVINYEGLPWLAKFLTDLGKPWPFKTVIADESTRLKSFRKGGSVVRSKALARFMPSTERFIALTGTPSPNGLQDLWGQLWFIDAGQRLGRSFTAFRERWFRPIRMAADAFAVRWEPYDFADEQIMGAIKDVCLSIKAEDYFDVDKPRFVDVPVQLPAKAMTAYKSMEKQLYAELKSGDVIEATNAASKTIKCLQIASGAVYTDEVHNWTTVHDAKLDALESIVEEAAGEPLLVAYQFVSDRERIKARFSHAVIFDKDPATVVAFNAGKISMLLVHPASAGHGLSLQDGSSKLVLFSQWWDLEQYQQVIERIGPMRQIQAGHPRVVTVYNLIASGTIDETVMQRKQTKARVQDLLMQRMAAGGY